MLALRLARIAIQPVRRCLATTTSNHTRLVTTVPPNSASRENILLDLDGKEKWAVHASRKENVMEMPG